MRPENILANNDDLSPQEELLVAIIRQAIADRDFRYFQSMTFKCHCELMDIKPDAIISNIKRLHEWGKRI